MDYGQRRDYRFDLFGMLWDARRITNKDTIKGKETDVYRSLKFFLETHGMNNPHAFIKALVKDSEDGLFFVINQILSYKPIGRWDRPEYHNVAATKISA